MTNAYVISFSKTSFNQLLKLDRSVIEAIVDKLLRLARTVDLVSHKALTGEWRGLYRLRVGDYRVIYSLDHLNRVVMVEIVGHRREVYDE